MPGEAPMGACDEELVRRREKEMRYKKWLEQVTINAVEQALRVQLDESQRLLPVGEMPESQACSSTNTSNNILSIHNHCNARTWSLDRNSEERRTVAARIYSLLVLWKPDVSFEWRARVASAVHIFERALYEEAKSREEYMNPLMLDLQLRQILRHFEAGTGSSLLGKATGGNRPQGHLTKSVSFNSGLTDARRRPIALGDLMKMHDASLEETSVRPRPGTIQTLHEVECNDTESRVLMEQLREDSDSSPSMQRHHVRREEADGALWEAILSGKWKDMEDSLDKHRDIASKRVVKRVMGLMCKRKREEEKKLEGELLKAINELNVDRLTVALSRARSEFREELKELCENSAAVLEQLLLEKRSEDSGESTESGVPGRVVESRRERESTEMVSIPQVESSPSRDRRQTNTSRLSRSVTFSFHETLQSRRNNESSTGDRLEPVTQTDQSRVVNVDRAAMSSSVQERSEGGSFSQVLAHARNLQGRERRLLGSLLDESLEENGSLPVGRLAHVDRQDSSPGRSTSRDQSAGEMMGTNSAVQTNIAPLNELAAEQEIVNLSFGVSDSLSSASEAPRNSLITLLHQEADPESVFLLNRRRLSLAVRQDTSRFAEELSEEMVDGGMDPICCVCMVGKKGAAFIPCGHTFCRKCSRELRKGRGTCPLCNRNIQDVLKIF